MAWSRFDDGFYDHPKILGLSHPAFRLCVCAITYSSRHNTGGALAKPQVAALCRLLDVPAKAAKELVEAGCWHETPDGYRIHDYEKYHPKDPTSNDRQQRYREAHRNGHSNGSVTDESVTGGVTATVTDALQSPLSQALRQRDSRGATRAEPDPTRPVPEDIDIPETTDRPASSVGRSSQNGYRGEKRSERESFIAETLKDHPHWQQPLDEAARDAAPSDPSRYRARILRNWLDGDGTPPEPDGPESSVPRPKHDYTVQVVIDDSPPIKRNPVSQDRPLRAGKAALERFLKLGDDVPETGESAA